MWFFNRKKKNTQPQNARIAHRAVKLAKLAEVYNIPLSENADRVAEITDQELEALNAGTSSQIVGCPANITPIFAGCSQTCAGCPYFLQPERKRNGCALREN